MDESDLSIDEPNVPRKYPIAIATKVVVMLNPSEVLLTLKNTVETVHVSITTMKPNVSNNKEGGLSVSAFIIVLSFVYFSKRGGWLHKHGKF